MRLVKPVLAALATLCVITGHRSILSAGQSQTAASATATVTNLGGLDECVADAVYPLVINASGAIGGTTRCIYSSVSVPGGVALTFNPNTPLYWPIAPPADPWFGGHATVIRGINDAGTIVSESLYGDLMVFPGGGLLTPLAGAIVPPFGLIGALAGINNAGEVVGSSYFGEQEPLHPTLWVGGSPIDLGPFDGLSIVPRALAPNLSASDRIIVGNHSSPPGRVFTVGVVWQNGAWSELPGAPGCRTNFTDAFDVSDDGVVVGVENECGYGGVIWEGGQIRSLNDECQLAGGTGAGALKAIALTPGGRHIIAGHCGVDRPAVFYDDGTGNYTAQVLPLLDGDSLGVVYDVNRSGRIVGQSWAPGGSMHAVRWDVTLPGVVPDVQGSLSINDDPVVGATIQLKKKGIPIVGTTTDGSGAYHFDPVAAGTYTILTKSKVVLADTSTVSGNVTVKGAPSVGRKAKLKNLDTKVTVATTTDASGNFSFAGVAAGNYKVTVLKIIVP